MQRYLDEFTFWASNRQRVNGCLTFWLGRCDALHQRIKLSGNGRADAFGLGLRDEVRQAVCAQV